MKGLDDFVLQPTLYSERVKAQPLEIFLVILIAGSLAGKRVCENVRKHEKIFYGTEYEGLLSQAEENSVMKMEEAERMQEPESEWEPEFMQVQEQNRREPKRRRMPNWLQNLIEVMLYHELYKRRSDHRRSRHRIY